MNDNQTIPTRTDINVYDSLDERSACERFLGKSLDEAETLFRQNTMGPIQDLLWMGPVAFRFYVRAAITYIESEYADGDSDSINSLAGTLSHWQEYDPAELVPCACLLADFCRTVFEQFDRYDADPAIYVGLREQYQHLAELFTHIADVSRTA